MKKLLVLLLVVAMMFSFVACESEKDTDDDATKKPKVTATATATDGLENGGNKVTATSPVKKTEAPTPTLEPTPATAAKKTITFGRISIEIPSNYIETTNEGIKVYYTDKYPTVADSIQLTKAPADSIALYTKEGLEQSFAAALGSTFKGLEVFEKTKIDGVDVLVLGLVLNANGLNCKQLQYFFFFDDMTIDVAFGVFEGSESGEEFEAIFNSIKVVK